jgi:hypothetical protein
LLIKDCLARETGWFSLRRTLKMADDPIANVAPILTQTDAMMAWPLALEARVNDAACDA